MLKRGEALENLITLLNIESYSNHEEPVALMLMAYLPELGFETWQDELGNVYAKRGEADFYPQFNAHMDSVKGYSNKGYGTLLKPRTCGNCKAAKECIGVEYYNVPRDKWGTPCSYPAVFKELGFYSYIPWGNTEKEEEVTEEKEEAKKVVASYNEELNRIVGDGSRPIGGDDKCGIAMALTIAEMNIDMPMKLFFSVGEEIGCIGVSHAIKNHQDFFLDNLYAITIDRNGNDDICFTSAGDKNGRYEFMAQLFGAWGMNGIVPIKASGSSADVVYIRKVVKDCVNIACGYFNPHTNTEYVDVTGYFKILTALDFFVKTYMPKHDTFASPYAPAPAVVYSPKSTPMAGSSHTNIGKEQDSGSTNISDLLGMMRLLQMTRELTLWETTFYGKYNKAEFRKKLVKFIVRLNKNPLLKMDEYVGVNTHYDMIDTICINLPDDVYAECSGFEVKRDKINYKYYLGWDDSKNAFVRIFVSTKDIEDGIVDAGRNLVTDELVM